MRAAFGPMTASVFSRVRAQRQHAVVLQQHDRLACRFERQSARLGVVGDLPRVRLRRLGMLEQTRQEFQAQHAAHGRVDLAPARRSLRQRRAAACA